jgi:hypothetical protein
MELLPIAQLSYRPPTIPKSDGDPESKKPHPKVRPGA